jgi:hypothetical protein
MGNAQSFLKGMFDKMFGLKQMRVRQPPGALQRLVLGRRDTASGDVEPHSHQGCDAGAGRCGQDDHLV